MAAVSDDAPCGSGSPSVDVRAIRVGLKMTQPAFAQTFGVPLATLRDWEQGRNKPDAAAKTLLRVITHRPDAVRDALAEATGRP